jgi:uncharacterized protein (DUF952 family)
MCRRAEWEAAETVGAYHGSSQDIADGFIHFSNGEQIVTSAAKHRAGQGGLVLIAVDPGVLGSTLKWEESRLGALFPHLYGALKTGDVSWVRDLPLGPDGLHQFPEL